jgi:hypothetical protein
MSRPDARLLWSRYLAARDAPSPEEPEHAARRLRVLEARLVARYSPLAKSVARAAAPRPPARPRRRRLLGRARSAGRREDLRPAAGRQVRVLRRLQDPLVRPRRAQEGGPPPPPRPRAAAGRRRRQGPRAPGPRARAPRAGAGRGAGRPPRRAPRAPRPPRAGVPGPARGGPIPPLCATSSPTPPPKTRRTPSAGPRSASGSSARCEPSGTGSAPWSPRTSTAARSSKR